MKTHFYFCAALAVIVGQLRAAPGDLDLTFGGGTGKVTTAIGGGYDGAKSVAMQGDGKIVVGGKSDAAGNFDFAIVRYDSDGGLDTSFNGTGKVTTAIGIGSDECNSVAVQGDGKIVAAGIARPGTNDDFAVVRYNANGSLDTSFNGNGKVTTGIGSSDGAYGMTLQTDGKIVATGYALTGNDFDFAVVRYNTNGSLDTTFNSSGKATIGIGNGHDIAFSVAVQADGKIVLAGFAKMGSNDDFAVARYNANGSLDTSFNVTGRLTTPIGIDTNDQANSVAIQADGKIVAAGVSNGDIAVVRYNPNGSLDTSFNGTGKVTTAIGGAGESGMGLAVESDGKIIVAGYSEIAGNNDFAVVVYNANGSFDTSFNGTGKVTTAIGASTVDVAYSVAVQRDGRIVAAGHSNNGGNTDFALARYEKARLSASGPAAVALGASATFTATLIGSIPLSFQWMKDGATIPGATGSTFTIPAAQPWHVGDYSVTATTALGTSISNVVLLQVIGVPTALWRGLLAFYPFQGNAQDRTVGAAHAAVNGAALTTDRMGQANRAYEFDGIDDQLTAPIPYLPVGNAPRTLSVWAKVRPDAARIFRLAEWGTPQDGRAYGLGSSSDFYTWTGQTFGTGPGVNTGVTVNPAWHHVCLTCDGANLSIYLDGALKQIQPATLNTGISTLKMGVGIDGTAYFPGSLDEVRIYNRALTPSEVQQLYAIDDLDTDHDGIIDRFETGTGIYVSATDTGTNPFVADTDGDGLNDSAEINTWHSNPFVTDTDGDGFTDGFEVSSGFDPTSAQSAPEEFSAMRPAREFRFSAANGLSYRIEGSTDAQTWTTLETNIIGTGGAVARFYVEEELGPRYFLRVRKNQ